MSARAETRYSTARLTRDDGSSSKVQCLLCPHRCALDSGEIGKCVVRRNLDGRLVTSANRIAVAHIDAIERKPLYHFVPGAEVVTLATPGCTFACRYCLNHGISQVAIGSEPNENPEIVELDPSLALHVGSAVERDRVIGMSYTEPSLAFELAMELFELAESAGVHVVWKSNGFLTPTAIDLVAPHLSAINIDVKAASDRAHRDLTGAALAPVLDAIARFRSHNVWVEVATPVAPGLAASDIDLDTISQYLISIDPAIPWHLVRFVPDYRMTRHPPTSVKSLCRARDRALSAGLQHVYVERALGADGRNTTCARCDAILVERGVWSLERSRVQDGRCPECSLVIDGRWTL